MNERDVVGVSLLLQLVQDRKIQRVAGDDPATQLAPAGLDQAIEGAPPPILGGLTGAAIGGATRGGRGAAVGAAIGVGAGALIGGPLFLVLLRRELRLSRP